VKVVVKVVVPSARVLVVVVGKSSVRYGGVVVVAVVVVTTGVKQEQAWERTELGTPFKSKHSYFKAAWTLQEGG
jgi:hypothetical protein